MRPVPPESRAPATAHLGAPDRARGSFFALLRVRSFGDTHNSILRLALVVALVFAALPAGLSFSFDRNNPVAPLPEPDPPDPKKVDLGRTLFFDPILSAHENLTCASCHDLQAGGTIAVRRAIGLADGRVLFNVPTIFNVSNNHSLGWRGRIKTLDAQNEKVLMDPNLMAMSWDELLPRLERSPAYRARFREVYGERPRREAVLDAIASFEISLRTPDAPFDRFVRGEKGALSPEQAKGYALFRDYGCVSCHQGSNIGGNMVQRLGVFSDDDLTAVEGAEAGVDARENREDTAANTPVAERDLDTGGDFRVPSLRNVAVTAPYFHDGRAETLPQAVSLMGRLQLGRDLSDPDVAAITAFLESLTGRFNNRSLELEPSSVKEPSSTDPVVQPTVPYEVRGARP